MSEAPTENSRVIVIIDPAQATKDVEALILRLQTMEDIEVLHVETVERPRLPDLLAECGAMLKAMDPLLPRPSTLPYWRRFERKRRMR